jgi:hypothetical protein
MGLGEPRRARDCGTFTALPDDALPDLGAAFLAALGAAFLNTQVVTCLEPCVRATTLFTRALPMKVEVAIFGGGVGWRWSLRTPNPRVRSVDRTRRNTPQPCPRPHGDHSPRPQQMDAPRCSDTVEERANATGHSRGGVDQRTIFERLATVGAACSVSGARSQREPRWVCPCTVLAPPAPLAASPGPPGREL